MQQLRRVIPLALSVGLTLALGGLAFRSSSEAEKKASAIHRADGVLLQENLGRLTNQYLLISAKELLDFTQTQALSLEPGSSSDRQALEGFLRRSQLFNYGVAIANLDGLVITSTARGPLPPADAPQMRTIKDGLLNEQPGVSGVVRVGKAPVVTVAVPVMDDLGFPKALMLGYWRSDTSKLQEYNAQLHYEKGARAHVVDAWGTVVTSNEPGFIGRSLKHHPALARGPITHSGVIEFSDHGKGITSVFGAVQLGNWSLVRDVRSSAFYGPIRDGRKQIDLTLVSLLGIAAALLVLLNRRGERARRRSEGRFRSLVQNASDVITVVGSDGRVLFDSPAVSSVLGYSPEERFGQPIRLFVHPDRVEWVEGVLEELGSSDGALVRGEVPVRRRDGSFCWLEVTFSNMLHDPAVKGIVINQRDVSERVALHQQLTHQAFHDALTGLPNRTLFNNRLEAALAAPNRRSGAGIGVLFLDLDRFKVINDSLGHEGGDRLLVEVALRLGRTVRRGDTLARLSGDEFAVLLLEADLDRATQVADRLIDELRKPFVVHGQEVVVGTSVGIAMAEPGQRPEDLVRHADLAMYRAKERGRRCYQVFETDLGDRSRQRLEMEAELRRAIDHGELTLYYQPEVTLDSGDIVGFEALIRWNHPNRGLLQPAHFIPLAEETGLIVPIGEWVLQEACAQLARWQRELPGQPLHMSVNVSNRQIQQGDLPEMVSAALHESGIEASSLVLELTEGVLMEDPDTTITVLRRLRDLGVALAIDDFGTGYSSLSYLKHFPISSLKIDRSFVLGLCDDNSDAAIAEAVVNLAHSLDVAVTAEGVELPGQVERLRTMQCDRAQGFHFARPMPAAQAGQLLKAGSFPST